MASKSLKNLILAGVFIALGVMLPVFFHFIGPQAGSIFLPMHIPVIIAGFFLGIPYALAVGIITPFLSSLFTGMPPFFPVMFFMMAELAAYGAVASLLSKKLKLNTYIALIGSMITGRIAAAIAVWILATFFAAKLPSPMVFIIGAVTKGIPGIIIQLIFVPTVVYLLNKNNIMKEGI